MSDQKEFIRAEALRHRQALQVDPAWAEQAADQFLSTLNVPPGSVVSVYYPKGKELDTLPLVETLWAKKIFCALPVMQPDAQTLKFAMWNQDTSLVEGSFGIPVPSDPHYVTPHIVVVPLLIFDQVGHRLGYGKGFYDVTLKHLRELRDITAVGYAYAEQACLFALPREDHDEKLDLVVTPQRVFDFRT